MPVLVFFLSFLVGITFLHTSKTFFENCSHEMFFKIQNCMWNVFSLSWSCLSAIRIPPLFARNISRSSSWVNINSRCVWLCCCIRVGLKAPIALVPPLSVVNLILIRSPRVRLIMWSLSLVLNDTLCRLLSAVNIIVLWIYRIFHGDLPKQLKASTKTILRYKCVICKIVTQETSM